MVGTFFISLALLSVSLVFNYKMMRINGELERFVPEERIEYFDLFTAEDEPVSINSSDLHGGRPCLIFFLSRPCSACDQNVTLVNRISSIMKNEIRVFGVILDTYESAREFVQRNKAKFKIYVPGDLARLEKEMNFSSNEAMTLIYHNGKAVYRKKGNISGEDYTRILKILKKN